MNMAHARSVIESWRLEYNTERPHSVLGYLTPAPYAAATQEALALRASVEEEPIEISLARTLSRCGTKNGSRSRQ